MSICQIQLILHPSNHLFASYKNLPDVERQLKYVCGCSDSNFTYAVRKPRSTNRERNQSTNNLQQ